MITITPAANEKITEILAESGDTASKLRVFVQGGGCSGFSYGFTLDDTTAEDDFMIETGTVQVLVDSISMQYLTDSKIDYVEQDMGSSFTIVNPNATTTCGCGSSFSID